MNVPYVTGRFQRDVCFLGIINENKIVIVSVKIFSNRVFF